MDWLHLTGVEAIVKLQQIFQGSSELMLLSTHAGDPRNAFLICFPLAYFCRPSVGIKVMWVAAISEWLNAILKWMLHGERPYWWVKETDLYKDDPPELWQYSHTCETGPGSPSGHAMVTASVWYIMVSALIQHRLQKSPHRGILSVLLWVLYAVFMTAVCISRLFIATHFPHQVVFGTFVGILLGLVCNRLPTENYRLLHYVISASFLLVSGPAVYSAVEHLGYDPMWSVTLAQRWCARPDWIYLDTTLFFGLVRDSSSLMGLGFALQLMKLKVAHEEDGYRKVKETEFSPAYALCGSTLSILLCRGSEYIPLPHNPVVLFYGLAYAKYFLLPCILIIQIAGLSCWLLQKLNLKVKDC